MKEVDEQKLTIKNARGDFFLWFFLLDIKVILMITLNENCKTREGKIQ
jgi:hypothetical protein